MGFKKKMKLGGSDGEEGVIGKGLERREGCGLGGENHLHFNAILS